MTTVARAHTSPDAQPALRTLPFDPPVLLAPMEGLTSKPFRDALEPLGGLGAVCTEFVGEGAGISRKVARRTVVKGRTPLIVQLLGNDPERLAIGTTRMVEAGAFGIDLNVGCPSSCVTGGNRGAALLRDLPRLGRILRAMVGAAGSVPVSAKVRAGWDDPDQLLKIAATVEDAGCAFLTIHGRTFKQGYDGEARLDLIRAARARVSIPVVANGDIVRAAQAVRILERGECDGVMIGRGAVRNPWIFAQIAALRAGRVPPAPDASDLASMLGRFEACFLGAFGAHKRRAVLAKMKEIVNFLAPSVLDGGAFRDAARRSQSLEELHVVIAKRLRPLSPEQVPLAATDL